MVSLDLKQGLELGAEAFNPTELVEWVQQQPAEDQPRITNDVFGKLMGQAAQSKRVSGKACTKLCGLVEQASKAQSMALRDFAYSQTTILSLFDFYVQWNETEQHRSMQSVLDLVPNLITRNPCTKTAYETKSVILKNLMEVVSGKSTKPQVKSSLRALDFCLNRSLFRLEDVSKSYADIKQLSLDERETVWDVFVAELFNWMETHFLCPLAGKLILGVYLALLKQAREASANLTNSTVTASTFITWQLAAMQSNSSRLESIKLYIFIPFFKADRVEALEFLREINKLSGSVSDGSWKVDDIAALQLAALEIGKKVGLVQEPGSATTIAGSQSESILLSEQMLIDFLGHPVRNIRSSALSLIVLSNSFSRPYSTISLDLLRKHLPHFFPDFDAKFRMEVMSKTKSMYMRLRGAISTLDRGLQRTRSKQKPHADNSRTDTSGAQLALAQSQKESLTDHETFLTWLFTFLREELVPTASYQRHFAALRATIQILKIEADDTKSWGQSRDDELLYSMFDMAWVRLLLDLVLDPFDDVREGSAQVLRQLFSDSRFTRLLGTPLNASITTYDVMTEFVRKAGEEARRSGRADKADGSARSWELLFRFSPEANRLSVLAKVLEGLDAKLLAAERDLGTAVLGTPVHGDFASLCYIWQSLVDSKLAEAELQGLNAVQYKILGYNQRIWNIAKNILCDDSPEGHLPLELEDLEGLETQDLLSYCFRAIIESSNLARIIVTSMRSAARQDLISPPPEVFIGLGNLTFNQLSSLRHRGAFSTVTLTFWSCCQADKFLDLPGASPRSTTLLDEWYKGAMDSIFAQVSTTRRSAGIPALITGILSANAQRPSFESVMNSLISLAKTPARVAETDGSKLPQVHALNCLKDIYKSSYISRNCNTEGYLTRCLELAATCMKSEVWAIRNCGLLFLRSLIDSLLGTSEAKSSMEAGWDGKATRIAYHKYPTLPNALVSLLESSVEAMAPNINAAGADAVFPALDIIRRAGPPDEVRDALYRHIVRYLCSPVWHVREMAARTLCSCLLHDQWIEAIEEILQGAKSDRSKNSMNSLHGSQLVLKFTVEKFADVMPARLARDLPRLRDVLAQVASHILTHSFANPDLVAAHVEILNAIARFELQSNQVQPGHSLNTEMDHNTTKLIHMAQTGSQSAMLKLQLTIHAIYQSTARVDVDMLIQTTLATIWRSPNTAAAMLEQIPRIMDGRVSASMALSLVELYIRVCLESDALEVRIVALHNLAETLDFVVEHGEIFKVPMASLLSLWQTIESGNMSPSLADAIVRVSGPIMAIFTRQETAHEKILAERIPSWGLLVADAGLDDMTFDSRYVAALSLKSFFRVVGAEAGTAVFFLTPLLALYDALNDDDDEVRDLAAEAAREVLGRDLVAIEAAGALLDWTADRFGREASYAAHVACRIAGHATPPFWPATADMLAWTPAREQLSNVMRVDDTLFAVEEQNLFIDEVRETRRWAGVFARLDAVGPESDWFRALTSWTLDGLGALAEAAERDDGPLGWTSQPGVYALCTRIILCARALLHTAHVDEAADLLRKLAEQGRLSRFHPLLLEMAESQLTRHSA